MSGFTVDVGALQSARSQMSGIADQVSVVAGAPEPAAGSVAAAFAESPANGALMGLGQRFGSVLQALSSGLSEDVGTLGQNVANYLAADESLAGG